jgi:Ca2+-binding EF-hand superfamily protein
LNSNLTNYYEATIDQQKILSKWENVFKGLDTNGDGYLDQKEFGKLAEYSQSFPQLKEFVKHANRLFEVLYCIGDKVTLLLC